MTADFPTRKLLNVGDSCAIDPRILLVSLDLESLLWLVTLKLRCPPGTPVFVLLYREFAVIS